MAGTGVTRMVTMSAVWDKAVAVIAGRTGILASIAALTIWLPAVVQGALSLILVQPPAAPTSGAAGLFMLVAILVLILALLGQLALVAVASDPQVTRGEAFRRAGKRLLPFVGLTLLLLVVGFMLLVPVMAGLFASTAAIAALRSGTMPAIAAGGHGWVAVYILVLMVVGIWLNARLLLFTPVVVNEHAGVRSFVRSFQLTRGLVWRIVGVVLLFAIVAIVVTLAVQSVTGIVFRLVLGAGQVRLALFLTQCVTALVGSAITIVIAAFTAQLYVATREASDLP